MHVKIMQEVILQYMKKKKIKSDSKKIEELHFYLKQCYLKSNCFHKAFSKGRIPPHVLVLTWKQFPQKGKTMRQT